MKAWLLVIFFVLNSFFANAEDQKSPLEKRFPNGLYNPKGEAIDLNSLKGKVIGVYFAASWCGPCRAFTPKLLEYYKKNRDHFEVVFVSSDQSEKSMNKYMQSVKMPWLHMKYKTYAVNWIEQDYDIYEIPSLILLNDKAETLVTDAKPLIERNVKVQKIAKAKVIKEKYKCDDCEDWHFRYKIDL